MIERIREFFASRIGAGASEQNQIKRRHLAAAALLVEVARADYIQDPQEVQALRDVLKQSFDIDAGELDGLLAMAEAQVSQATCTFEFTRLINAEFSAGEKSELIGAMWQVAFADGKIDKYEEHLIRKIADLIYVPHGEFIRRKLAARGA